MDMDTENRWWRGVVWVAGRGAWFPDPAVRQRTPKSRIHALPRKKRPAPPCAAFFEPSFQHSGCSLE